MSRAVMQQALEALEHEARTGNDDAYRAEREALRQALAEPQTTHWEGCEAVHPECRKPEQEPCAMRYDFDGYGYKYIDSGSGSNWQTRHKDAEPLYTAPTPQQHDTDCHLQGICQRSGYSIAPTPRKPLSEDQIVDIWAGVSMGYDDEINIIELARAIERHHGIGEQT